MLPFSSRRRIAAVDLLRDSPHPDSQDCFHAAGSLDASAASADEFAFPPFELRMFMQFGAPGLMKTQNL